MPVHPCTGFFQESVGESPEPGERMDNDTAAASSGGAEGGAAESALRLGAGTEAGLDLESIMSTGAGVGGSEGASAHEAQASAAVSGPYGGYTWEQVSK